MLGIIKNDLYNAGEIIRFNQVAKDIPLVVFCNNYDLQIQPEFNVLPLLEAFHFEGVMISSDIKSIQYMRNCCMIKESYYYCQSPEWRYIRNLTFEQLNQTIFLKDIKWLSTSKMVNIAKNVSIRPISFIIDDWDTNVLKQIIGETYE